MPLKRRIKEMSLIEGSSYCRSSSKSVFPKTRIIKDIRSATAKKRKQIIAVSRLRKNPVSLSVCMEALMPSSSAKIPLDADQMVKTADADIVREGRAAVAFAANMRSWERSGLDAPMILNEENIKGDRYGKRDISSTEAGKADNSK